MTVRRFAYRNEAAVAALGGMLILLSALLGGCATDAGRPPATAAAEAPEPAAVSLAAGRLAILTPTAPFGREEDRQALALNFSRLLAEHRPDLTATPMASTLSSVNAAGLSQLYGGMYAGHRETGLFDREALRQVGAAVGSRYLVQLKLGAFDQQSHSRFGWMGINLVQTQTANVRLFVQIWDSAEGRIVWERSAEAVLRERGVRSRTISMEDALAPVAGDLVRQLPA